MKRYMIAVILLIVLTGCTQKKEKVIENSGMIEVREDMPVKAKYLRLWIYALEVETEDPDTILELLEEIRDLKLGESTKMSMTDNTNQIIFEYEDGTSMHYEFEGNIYIKNSSERYIVTGGLDQLGYTLEQLVSGN
ncbi:MAG: hypothetical protein J6S49_06935 [Erysipelotrichaceae bacterium]|nr:hypothetical protein [Erysipelotrichaceae bacterium]